MKQKFVLATFTTVITIFPIVACTDGTQTSEYASLKSVDVAIQVPSPTKSREKPDPCSLSTIEEEQYQIMLEKIENESNPEQVPQIKIKIDNFEDCQKDRYDYVVLIYNEIIRQENNDL